MNNPPFARTLPEDTACGQRRRRSAKACRLRHLPKSRRTRELRELLRDLPRVRELDGIEPLVRAPECLGQVPDLLRERPRGVHPEDRSLPRILHPDVRADLDPEVLEDLHVLFLAARQPTASAAVRASTAGSTGLGITARTPSCSVSFFAVCASFQKAEMRTSARGCRRAAAFRSRRGRWCPAGARPRSPHPDDRVPRSGPLAHRWPRSPP
jgi:hypothetical protein